MIKRNSVPASVWRNPVHFIAFGFGSGAAPVAPGTFGTLAAIPIYLLIAPLSLWGYLAIVVVMTILGIWLCDVTSKDMGVHDHSGIVWDEIVGYLITMAAAPQGWLWVVVGFFLFRFFDILKPWPISWIDKHVKGGWGIMLDDILAGVFALLALQATHFFLF
jgi:phosphatidylglycerophosphatase A